MCNIELPKVPKTPDGSAVQAQALKFEFCIMNFLKLSRPDRRGHGQPPAPVGEPDVPADEGLDPARWWTLGVVCAATLVLLLDISIVNVALPDIQRDLGASLQDLQWVIDAYALTLAALMLTAGTLADRLGRRRIFLAGLVLFVFASLLCGLAGSPTLLDVARAVQGIGGAAMFATTLALLAGAFQGRERGTAFGIWGAASGASIALGPVVGGLLVGHIGWRAIFFVNLPIGLMTFIIARRKLRESKDPNAGRLDVMGVVTFSLALFLLIFALVRGNASGWTSGSILASLIGAVALFAAFLVVEIRQRRPMLDLSLFRKPAFAGVAIAAFTLSASIFAVFPYLTLYLQNTLGYSPLQTGLRFLPMTVMAFLFATLSGKLTNRVPTRLLLGLGLACIGGGLLMMTGLGADSAWTALLAGFLVCGAGVGLTNPAVAATAVGVVDPHRSGMAVAINNTFRQVGIATGVAALGALLQADVANRVREQVGPKASLPPAEILAQGSPKVLADAGQTYLASFTGGLNEILLIAGIVALAGAVAAAALVRRKDFIAYAKAQQVSPPDGAPAPASPADPQTAMAPDRAQREDLEAPGAEG
ncbi:MAG TPA: MFS transporter [Caulobacteraceae bacterium]|nr:MFS transporter [Caulobacteraceae bacterium]